MLNGNTFEIDLNGIKHNVNHIVKNYNYKYYIGVVKANAYGCGYEKVIETMENAGINYFAVGNLDEALKVRKETKKGILILTPVLKDTIKLCIKKDITVTVDSIEYLKSLEKPKNLKIHIKLNTGMNRFGTNDIDEIKEIIKYSKENDIFVEGIYTHLYFASNKKIVEDQIKEFNRIMKRINYTFKIIHIMNSEGLLYYDKFRYTNAIRIGDLLYGLTYDENYKSVFSLKTNIVELRKLSKGQTIGYDGAYTAEKDETIAILPIGYADGLLKVNTGRYVYINNKKYKIVGNICMCNTFVKVTKNIKQTDTVYIIKDSKDVMDINKYLSTFIPTASSEITCNINELIPKKYKELE